MLQPNSKLRIRRPSGLRKSFNIQICHEGSSWRTFDSEAVNTVNKALHDGHLSVEQAEIRVRQELARLYEMRKKLTPAPVFNEQNMRLLDRYLAEKYTPVKKSRMAPRSFQSQKYYLQQAFAYLATTPIEADINIIQETIDKALMGQFKKHKRMVSVLNSILLWLGRSDRLLPFS
jgi:hypothetical protein